MMQNENFNWNRKNGFAQRIFYQFLRNFTLCTVKIIHNPKSSPISVSKLEFIGLNYLLCKNHRKNWNSDILGCRELAWWKKRYREVEGITQHIKTFFKPVLRLVIDYCKGKYTSVNSQIITCVAVLIGQTRGLMI